MVLLNLLLITIVGLVVGSFLSVLTYRLPRKKSVKSGRSVCDNCGKEILWYDNIPLLSYLLLSGKCRNCGKKISPRYPLIETSTAVLFVLSYITFQSCSLQGPSLQVVPICFWRELLGVWALPFLLIIGSILIAILVIDIERQIIPDNLVFILLALSFAGNILGDNFSFYSHLFSGFGASLFLMLLHFVTLGRGMGLGDVKLVIPMGMLLGSPYTLVWFYVSFVGGGLVGLILVIMKKAKFGREIAFGPFLIVAFFVTLFWGDWLLGYLSPFL